ncbi:flavoprotein [Kutzneria buriramensis]|uniref:Flavoprotein n=1 Tax=Kutzneria buriramensis TaxID=1045776 RepID=A0A3E0HEA2_9PSEU|nr:flavoprotein [Kutzneria buriramensis]REH43527.1 flavoprotein [Kutzneria buriramensis]
MSDNPTFGGRLLIGAGGSGAVALLPVFLSALRAEFTGTVTVLMTHTATTFLPASTMGLFADQVVTGDDPRTWARDNHVTLAEDHDLYVVLPATANLLAAAATGAAPNLVATTVLESASPVAFFPVMSAQMWAKPAVQRNVAQLRSDGHEVIDPGVGPRYDVGLARVVSGPTPPAPPQFVAKVRELLR